MRWSRLARVWAQVVGGAAMRRAGPAWVGVAMLGGILFGPTGMRPSDLTGAALQQPATVGLALSILWLVLIAPVGAVLVDDRPTAYLRALPIGRGWPWGTVAAYAWIAQAPWTLLWALGEGVLAAIAASVLAALAMLGVASIRWPGPRRVPRWRNPVAALVGAHARAVIRRRAASVWRGAAVAGLGGAMAGLLVWRNGLGVGDAVVALLAVSSVAVPAAVGALTAPVAESDRDLGWLLASAGCGAGARVLAMALTLGIVGAMYGVGVGAIAAALAGRAALALVASGAALGAIVGVLAVRVGAWVVRIEGGDGTRAVLGAIMTGMVSIVAVGALGAPSLGLLAALAGALVAPMASRPLGAIEAGA